MPDWYPSPQTVDERIAVLEAEIGRDTDTIAFLQESLAELEAATDSVQWRRLAVTGQHEFSEDGLRRIVTVCQLVAIKNPLVKRGLALRAAYTWAQGVDISAADPRVDKVIQEFLADDRNQDALFGPTARVGRDVSSGTDGNLFIACFTSPLTGRVKVRTVPFLEIGRTIYNPNDRLDPWFYRRDYCIESVDQRGNVVVETRYVWHPALGDHPGRPKLPWIESSDRPVQWDAPMLHMYEDRPDGWTYGIPLAYAAVDWALAYKDFLSDWAIYMKALSQFAWRQTGPGRKQAKAMAALASVPALDPTTGEPRPRVGATAMMGLDQNLEAIPKTGATIDAHSGSPLAEQVAVALGFPITMLLADPSRGDRSAAENLDRPTELLMELHQTWWAAGYQRLFAHVIRSSVAAPKGHLRGRITREDDQEVVTLANGRSAAVRITFPELDDLTPAAMVDAIVKADQTGVMPHLAIFRKLCDVLNFPDAEELEKDITDENGDFKPPKYSALLLAAQKAKPPVTSSVNPADPAPAAPDPAGSPAKARNREDSPGGNEPKQAPDASR